VGIPNGGPVDHRRYGMAFCVGLTLLAGVALQAGDSGRSVAADPRDASAAAPAQAPQSRSPLAQGPVPDLNLVFTAQAVGWIEPCG